MNANVDITNADDIERIRGKWLDTLRDLNVCSQRGLVEMFDGSIGAGSVFMPYGGKYQLTETQVMAAKVPVPGGKTDTVTLMSYGFDPYLMSWSPLSRCGLVCSGFCGKIAVPRAAMSIRSASLSRNISAG